jgi:hypothetical protein
VNHPDALDGYRTKAVGSSTNCGPSAGVDNCARVGSRLDRQVVTPRISLTRDCRAIFFFYVEGSTSRAALESALGSLISIAPLSPAQPGPGTPKVLAACDLDPLPV